MNNKKYSGYIFGAVLILLGIFLIVTFNGLVKKDERVKLQWNEVQNAYQRRLDLIPNLVNTVKGNAGFEQNVLVAVTEARAKANFVNVSANNVSANAYNVQTQAQDELATSANRLLITIEKYPELQGTKAFTTLQTQLERTELRIKIARKDFNESIQNYNSSVRGFPTKIVAGIFGFNPKDGFNADAGAEKVTEIKF
jgi:LemA protein